MEKHDQNWKNFYQNHLGDWHGLWTRYTFEGEIIEVVQSLRSLQGDSENTDTIYHTNRYIYSDGRTVEKSWDWHLNKRSNAFPLLQSLFFECGAAAWVTKQLEVSSFFQVELFFRHEDLRLSVPVIYNDNSSNRVVTFREDKRGFPSLYWSEELNLLTQKKFSKDWQGNRITMTPDLKVSASLPTKLNWGSDGYKNFFLPDGVSVSCPPRLEMGKSFSITANWLVTDSYLQQITTHYDDCGAFSTVTFEDFYLSNN